MATALAKREKELHQKDEQIATLLKTVSQLQQQV
jgi:hypothetical protein